MSDQEFLSIARAVLLDEPRPASLEDAYERMKAAVGRTAAPGRTSHHGKLQVIDLDTPAPEEKSE